MHSNPFRRRSFNFEPDSASAAISIFILRHIEVASWEFLVVLWKVSSTKKTEHVETVENKILLFSPSKQFPLALCFSFLCCSHTRVIRACTTSRLVSMNHKNITNDVCLAFMAIQFLKSFQSELYRAVKLLPLCSRQKCFEAFVFRQNVKCLVSSAKKASRWSCNHSNVNVLREVTFQRSWRVEGCRGRSKWGAHVNLIQKANLN